jgi:hypothetical protein
MDVFLIDRHPSWNYAQFVQEICSPLFEVFDINYFDYARFYPNGDFVMLFSDPAWVKCFLNEFAYDAPHTVISEGPHLWQSYIPQHILSCASDKFSHSSGVTIFNKQKEYSEIINVSSANDKVIDFYLNQYDFLLKFISYFKERAAPLIDKLKEKPLTLKNTNGQPILNYEEQYKKFIELVNASGHQFGHVVDTTADSHQAKLTKREKECLGYLLRGMSAKQLGKNFISLIELSSIISITSKINLNVAPAWSC